MQICVYGASSDDIAPVYMEQTEKLGAEMASRGHGLIFGGGAHGLMGAAARGVSSVGGTIVGVAPHFFHSPGILYEQCTQMIRTETMRERKEQMEQLADAFIMVPGGIGTFEEFFEILTLRQLGRHGKPIGIFNVNGYYDPLLALLEHAAAQGFLNKECLQLYTVSKDPAELLDQLTQTTAGIRTYKPV
ncbi:MAG: TIGR00730 family Rossman fold protein [Clostridia bacterium]|nr:TIGR00730 family Rossman fold protein [Clostridia bacterium]